MPSPACKITVLGSGTSVGIPTIGCHCDVCTSTDPRDNRLRPSILVSYEGRNVLIDTTPDFRTQALRARIDHLDAVLFTHSHADHLMGLDDVRPFNYRQKGQIPIYAAPETMAAVQRCFQYIFDGGRKESNVPKLEASSWFLVARAAAPDRHWLLALLWSSKESALKALHEGLRLDTRSVMVSPFVPAFDLNGWSPLEVRHSGGQVFHGWWQHANNILRTVVAAQPLDAPTALTIPPHIFDCASRCD